MRKERQIGIRVGVPAFFALELEDVYKRTEGAHRALAFPDFVGLLVGMGLEAYRKGKAPPVSVPEDIEEEDESDTLAMLDIPRAALPDLFRDFDAAIEERQEGGPRFQLVKGEYA